MHMTFASVDPSLYFDFGLFLSLSLSLSLAQNKLTTTHFGLTLFLDPVPSIGSTLRPGGLWLVKRKQTCVVLY